MDYKKRFWGSNLAIVFCVFVGLTMSVLPHMIGQFSVGKPVYFADSDDTALYLAYSAHAYHNNLYRLQDPIAEKKQGVFAPWIQLMPGTLLARSLSIPPIYITLILRIWAGIFVSIVAYLFIFSFVRRSVPSTALTCIFLTDAGQRTAYLLVKQFKSFAYLLMGRGQDLFGALPDMMLHWRIITPALSIGFLLLHFWAISEYSRQKPWSKPWLLFSAVSYGLLFHVYFYFWTAATLALGLLLIFNRERWKEWFLVGVTGSVIGLPAILLRMQTKAAAEPDWLFRNAFFMPVDRFEFFLLPKFAILLLVAGIVYYWRRREKDMLYLVCTGFISMILINQRVITGIDNHDNHWMYIGAPAIYLLGLIGIFRLLHERFGRVVYWPLIGLAGLMFVTGITLRGAEATMAGDSKRFMDSYKVIEHHRNELEAIQFEPLGRILGDEQLVTLLVIEKNLRPFHGIISELSSGLNSQEWNRRIAVNAFVRGQNEYDYKVEQYNKIMLGGWNYPKDYREKCYNDRMEFFRQYLNDPAKVLSDYSFRYVVLKAGEELPQDLMQSGKFDLLISTPTLRLWKRN